MELKQLQQKQDEYDKVYWQHNASQLEKIRHISLHMGKLLGKLSTYCEGEEHGRSFPTRVIEKEVVPDLLVYSLQLANLLGIDLETTYLERQGETKKRQYVSKKE